jgi:hypothetical protein
MDVHARARETEDASYQALLRDGRRGGRLVLSDLRRTRGGGELQPWDVLYWPRWRYRKGVVRLSDRTVRVELKASRVGADGYAQYDMKANTTTFWGKAECCDVILFGLEEEGRWRFAAVPLFESMLEGCARPAFGSYLGHNLQREHFSATPQKLRGSMNLNFEAGGDLVATLEGLWVDIATRGIGRPGPDRVLRRELPDRPRPSYAADDDSDAEDDDSESETG